MVGGLPGPAGAGGAGRRPGLTSGLPAAADRCFGARPLPAEAWALAVGANYTPQESRTDEQREALALAATLADEVLGADLLVLATPLYNVGISQYAEVWFDMLIADPRLGPGSTLPQGKPALLVVAQGGGYRAGTPRDGWDHATPYLQRILQDNFGPPDRRPGRGGRAGRAAALVPGADPEVARAHPGAGVRHPPDVLSTTERVDWILRGRPGRSRRRSDP